LTRDNYGTPKSERINDVDDIIFDEQIAGNTFFFPGKRRITNIAMRRPLVLWSASVPAGGGGSL
jgi:hypothetical protein